MVWWHGFGMEQPNAGGCVRDATLHSLVLKKRHGGIWLAVGLTEHAAAMQNGLSGALGHDGPS